MLSWLWNGIAWLSPGYPSALDSGLYIVLSAVLPCCIVYWVVTRQVTADYLQTWSRLQKLIYLFAIIAVVSSVIEWADGKVYGFWFWWFLVAALLLSAFDFWVQIVDREKAGNALPPPGWVGDAVEDNWRYRLWQGFMSGFLWVFKLVFGPKKPEPDTSFGAAHEASLNEIKKAGLL